MNDARRKEINRILQAVETLKYDIEAVREEEQEAFDNLPEAFQGGERGEQMEAGLGYMEEAAGNLEEVMDTLLNALGN